MSSDAMLPVTRGSDLTFQVGLGNGFAGLANLTGYVVTVFEAHFSLEGRIIPGPISPLTWSFPVQMLWADAIPTGDHAFFRLQLVPDTGYSLPRIGLPRLRLRVS
jgi:hypothetical protein